MHIGRTGRISTLLKTCIHFPFPPSQPKGIKIEKEKGRRKGSSSCNNQKTGGIKGKKITERTETEWMLNAIPVALLFIFPSLLFFLCVCVCLLLFYFFLGGEGEGVGTIT